MPLDQAAESFIGCRVYDLTFSEVIASDGLPCVTISVTNLSSESISSVTAAGFGGERDSSLRSDANNRWGMMSHE